MDLGVEREVHRDGIRGYWEEKSVPFDASLMKAGTNVIKLTNPGRTWTDGVLYDYLRLEFSRFSEAERQKLYKEAQGSVAMVAQKVLTYEDHRKACSMGFTLFQGDYFCHPVLLKKRKVPANGRSHFEIVRELYHDPIDIRKVGQLVRRDAALTYRLLRLVNSPVYGIYKEVRSVEAAITVLGEATFRRVVSLAVLSELNGDQPSSILQMALVRARFCELAARQFGQDAGEQYLLGMLSLLPAMLGVPMEEIVPILPLRGQICEALAGTVNPERRLLGWLESHEHGDWESCDRIVNTHRLDTKLLIQCYLEAPPGPSSRPLADLEGPDEPFEPPGYSQFPPKALCPPPASHNSPAIHLAATPYSSFPYIPC